jgi:hypothetical protein
MKPVAIVGLLLIVVGLLALAYQGFTYTSRETVLNVGPIHATADRDKTIALPPILGIGVVGCGMVLLIAGVHRAA